MFMYRYFSFALSINIYKPKHFCTLFRFDSNECLSVRRRKMNVGKKTSTVTGSLLLHLRSPIFMPIEWYDSTRSQNTAINGYLLAVCVYVYFTAWLYCRQISISDTRMSTGIIWRLHTVLSSVGAKRFLTHKWKYILQEFFHGLTIVSSIIIGINALNLLQSKKIIIKWNTIFEIEKVYAVLLFSNIFASTFFY